MEKSEIQKRLQEIYTEFAEFIASLPKEEFLYAPAKEKWTSGQQAAHLLKSVRPLNIALALPEWFLKIYVGKANRPSKSYKQLVERYEFRLSEGGRTSGPYIPEEVSVEKQAQIADQIKQAITRLCHKLEKYSESSLDALILPHPLLGKVTMREMMYFTIHHGHHHLNSVRDNLRQRNPK